MKHGILLSRDAVSAIATVTLSNPKRRNAIDAAMWRELKATKQSLDADDTLRCAIIRGARVTFAVGGDVDGGDVDSFLPCATPTNRCEARSQYALATV